MGNFRQRDFSGGMVDTDLGKGIPGNSYQYAENLMFDGDKLGYRGKITQVSPVGPDGTVLGYHRYVSGAYGDVIIQDLDTSVGLCLTCLKFTSAGSVNGYFVLRFAAGPGIVNGLMVHDAVTLLGDAFVMIQVGTAAYFWCELGAAKYAFRWDGQMVTGHVLERVATAADIELNTEWVPAARAGVFAYGRVFLATAAGAAGTFNAVGVSKTVDDFDLPKLVFDEQRISCGARAGEDILGFCPFGAGRMLVFFRNSVWLMRECDREPQKMAVECLDPDHGCVGAYAFGPVDGGVWFVSDDGVHAVSAAGKLDAVPLTAPISRFWGDHVSFATVPRLTSLVAHQARVHIGVPVDGAALTHDLVYDLRRRCWVGLWSDFPVGGFVVEHTTAGGQVKVVSGGGDLWRITDDVGIWRSGMNNVRFKSRVFDADRTLPTLFTRANLDCYGAGSANLTPPVFCTCDLATVDADTAATVTHHAGLVVEGHVGVPGVICRIMNRIYLDLTVQGIFHLFGFEIRYRGKGRG